MTTIRWNNTPILFEHLNKIIVDDPRTVILNKENKDIHLFNELKKKLIETKADKSHLSNKIIVRKCNYCYCRSNYLHEVSINDLKRFFIQTNL